MNRINGLSKNKFLQNLTIKKYKPVFLQKNIFNGDIILFKQSKTVIEIIEVIEDHFKYIFNIDSHDFLNKKVKIPFAVKEDLFFQLQKKIKKCLIINKKFTYFLEEIGFDRRYIYKDEYSLRYSPKEGEKGFGKLKPAPLHRDTWASNMFEQINFWFPIHKVSAMNSICLVPRFFREKIQNNSKSWNFDKFKKNKNYPSTPFTKLKVLDDDKLSIEVNKGSILCFSGHHLHGSLQNNNERINLETRVIYRAKIDKNIIPKNYDSYSEIKKPNWFKNIVTNEILD